MTNPPLEQQLLAGIEERNGVIERQYARIEALEAELRKMVEWAKLVTMDWSVDDDDDLQGDMAMIEQAQQALTRQP